MKHVKKFNEEYSDKYSDKNYDYTSFTSPITLDEVKRGIKEDIKQYVDEEVTFTEEMEQDIDMMAKRIMHGFWDQLTYYSDDHMDDYYAILDGSYE